MQVYKANSIEFASIHLIKFIKNCVNSANDKILYLESKNLMIFNDKTNNLKLRDFNNKY